MNAVIKAIFYLIALFVSVILCMLGIVFLIIDKKQRDSDELTKTATIGYIIIMIGAILTFVLFSLFSLAVLKLN